MYSGISRGEIYGIELEEGKGSEQGGYRPAVVIQNDVGNKYSPTVIVAMITSKHKTPLPTHLGIELTERSIIMFEQIRTIDKTRLSKYLGKLNTKELEELDAKLKISLGII